MTKENFSIGACQVERLTVNYKVDHLMGEPTVNGAFEWIAAPGTPNDCLPSNLAIWLRIENGQGHGYINISPTVPKSGEGFGFNTTGSPNWDRFICAYSGAEATDCLPASSAKQMYNGGSIVDFELSQL